MKYVFGPVPSRRLGRSLGIDPIPLKTCNWNCVYCQLGRTSSLLHERREYFPSEEIITEAKAAVEGHKAGQIDWLTFAGSGEPTLHANLGRIIAELKQSTDVPIAVITNGSLLYLPEVRCDLVHADAVLPTLDAGSERLYRRIDRPAPELTFARLVNGMIAFRREFTGCLWIEVVLVKGMNDSPTALSDLAAVIRRIEPDEVHICLPVRPPAAASVEPADDDGVSRAAEILGQAAYVVCPTAVTVDFSDCEDLAEAICEMVRRHPMHDAELMEAFGYVRVDDFDETLTRLASNGRVTELLWQGKRFWASADSQYTSGRRKPPLH